MKYSKVIVIVFLIALTLCIFISPFASSSPDGLEWALEQHQVHINPSDAIIKEALIHDYSFPGLIAQTEGEMESDTPKNSSTGSLTEESSSELNSQKNPSFLSYLATSLAGISGVAMTFFLGWGTARLLRRKQPK